MPSRSPTRGAHRDVSDPPAPDPVTTGGPRGWVVSAGVLTLLCVLGGAGALIVDGGGGAGASATVPADAAAGDGWTVATPTPGGGDAASPASGPGSGPGSGPASGPASGGESVPSAASGSSGIAEADRAAGVATRDVVQAGTGKLLVVPGSEPAPNPARRRTVRVEIEEGIGADGAAFADFVLATLNDPRSWGHGGALSFARTAGVADFRVILASPDTSSRLCAPARTNGTLSCGGNGRAVITMYRWMNGIPDYGEDRTAYRQYVVNHEVGHVLGHGHAYCDPGHLAPVMVQQTKGLRGCLPNPWPFPS